MYLIIWKIVGIHESVLIILIEFEVKVLGDEVKDASHEVGDDQSNQNQPENVVNVEYLVVFHNSYVVALVVLKRF